jgi:hypothetical protein
VNALTPWQRAKRYVRLSLFLAEAFFELCVARFKVSFVPFQTYKKELGHHMHVTSEHTVLAQQALAKRLSWAVQKTARYTPFKSNCMVQALAAKRMCKKRGLATTLYIGVGRDRGSSQPQKSNHAWLRSGSFIVTGKLKDLASYAIIGTYADEPQ